MKKYIILLILLVSWQYAMAGVITEDQARKRAAEFFTTLEKPTKAAESNPGEFRLVYSFPEIETRASDSDVAFYVFERRSGGYVIVSGDDVARPVLGYSPNGNFPVAEMPDNMRAMLQWYADIIAYAKKQNWNSAPYNDADFGLDPANIVQLHTAQWGQGHPFNDLAPIIDGKNPPIGCVATAVAIIMRYHQWPQRGTGVLPSYEYTYNGTRYHIDGYPLGHEYDWSKMPEDTRNYNEEEAAQIARLLYDVAVMSKMEFRPGGSGASEWEAALLLPKYFGYDKRVVGLARPGGLSDAQWERCITDEVDAKRPVLYSGGYKEGHAYVIDGYCGRYFSINYGWNGHTSSYDGHDNTGEFKDFYTLTPIEGHEKDLLLYNQYQSMMLGIMPDHGGQPDPFYALCVNSEPFLPMDFDVKKPFTLSFGISNSSLTSYALDTHLALYNRDGELKEIISSEFSMDIPANSGESTWVSCRITKKIEDGDRILICMKNPDSGQWMQVRNNTEKRIEFTTRPLSELVRITYSQEPQYPDTSAPERIRDIRLNTYRDCLWKIYGEDGKELLTGNHWISSSASYEYISWRSLVSPDPEDLPEDRMILHEVWLPSGNYRLYVRNPATGEEMEIKLEL